MLINRDDLKPSYVDAIGDVLVRYGLSDRELHHTFALWCVVPGQSTADMLRSSAVLLAHEGFVGQQDLSKITGELMSAIDAYIKQEGSPCTVPM